MSTDNDVIGSETTAVAIRDIMHANDTAEHEAELEEFQQNLERVVTIVVPIFFSLVVLVGFFGNLLVVLVVTWNKQMRNTTNLLILNLAWADILFIVFCVPFTATGYALPHDWPFGDIWCKVVQYLIIVTAYVSIYTLVFMSLDRFLAVVYPIQSISLRTDHNCRLAIGFTWAITLTFSLPVAFGHGEIQHGEKPHKYCMFTDNKTVDLLPESWEAKWSLLAFQLSFFVTAYLLPLLLICGLYSVMLYRLWNTAPGGRASAESIKNKKKVIKMVLIVVVIFALSWLPIHIILVLKAMKKYTITPISITVQIISHILAYSNSCINPILYAFLSPPFRQGFWQVITCIKPSGPHGVQQNGYEMADVEPVKRAKEKFRKEKRGGGGEGASNTNANANTNTNNAASARLNVNQIQAVQVGADKTETSRLVISGGDDVQPAEV